ncbi:MAG: 7-cyano-7-deazaguanine synthase QueC [Deltaproteobacteria bacterium]|nr:7-cyano-7-deazaguanine synthase QueC [Deltaproteobacteria bacterium]
MTRRAVVLLSGGLDSATVAAWARSDGFEVHPLTFEYGQRHRVEIDAARAVARQLGLPEPRVVRLDLGAVGGSALTDPGLDVPKDALGDGIPVTYVPARNTVFLAVALGLAEVLGAFDLFFGANAVDYSGYPDCRPAFVDAFQALANVATKAAVEGAGRFTVHAPLMTLTKAQIIQRGVALGVDYALTTSCYDPAPGGACGHCDSCLLRRRGFEDAGVPDPTRYAR